jgi:hypothetical protein
MRRRAIVGEDAVEAIAVEILSPREPPNCEKRHSDGQSKMPSVRAQGMCAKRMLKAKIFQTECHFERSSIVLGSKAA